MASIAIMIGGAILNATTFVGGSYLAKYMSGDDLGAERKRHDLALEKYEKDYQTWQKSRQRVMDWYSQRRDEQDIAARDLSNTDEALKLYNKVHSQDNEPNFNDYYKPSNSQKTGEIVYVSAGMLGIVYLASKFLYMSSLPVKELFPKGGFKDSLRYVINQTWLKVEMI